MLLIPPKPFTITARSEAGLGAAGDLFSWTAPLAVFFVPQLSNQVQHFLTNSC